jgi:hypothetical protein
MFLAGRVQRREMVEGGDSNHMPEIYHPGTGTGRRGPSR